MAVCSPFRHAESMLDASRHRLTTGATSSSLFAYWRTRRVAHKRSCACRWCTASFSSCTRLCLLMMNASSIVLYCCRNIDACLTACFRSWFDTPSPLPEDNWPDFSLAYHHHRLVSKLRIFDSCDGNHRGLSEREKKKKSRSPTCGVSPANTSNKCNCI